MRGRYRSMKKPSEMNDESRSELPRSRALLSFGSCRLTPELVDSASSVGPRFHGRRYMLPRCVLAHDGIGQHFVLFSRRHVKQQEERQAEETQAWKIRRLGGDW